MPVRWFNEVRRSPTASNFLYCSFLLFRNSVFETLCLQIEIFTKDSTVPVFLLSTRAGGLGLNLTAADTVIILDSDWVN